MNNTKKIKGISLEIPIYNHQNKVNPKQTEATLTQSKRKSNNSQKEKPNVEAHTREYPNLYAKRSHKL